MALAITADFGTLRSALLRLHKALLDAQKARYEREYGRIASSGDYLRVVLQHPSFEWLRTLSALIAELDELGETRGPEAMPQAEALVDTLRNLVRLGGPSAFAVRYREMIDEAPDAFAAHLELSRLFDGPFKEVA